MSGIDEVELAVVLFGERFSQVGDVQEQDAAAYFGGLGKLGVADVDTVQFHGCGEQRRDFR